ncbi:MAG: hypothetical protein ACNS60_04840 [Candidatus Cyclobacteriaceae bacterium M2_1C_046]
MEYSYKTGSNDIWLKLDSYSFTYTIDGESKTISYAQVNTLRMHYPRSQNNVRLFECTLRTIDGPTIHLKSYSNDGDEFENQFNHYNQFVRVLHIHLMAKSKAKFLYGMSCKKCILISLLILAILAVSYPITNIFTGHEILVLTIIPLIIGYIIYTVIRKRPVTYKPDIIPYHILPGSA